MQNDEPRRVALVTGASRGIGAATAIKLAEVGFDVAVAARTVLDSEATEGSGSLTQTATAIEKLGRRVLPIRMDLTDRGSVLDAAQQAEAEFGRIDVFVNCGIYQGPGSSGSLLGTSIEEIETTMQADIVSTVALLQTLLPGMVERGGGIVVNVSSAVAFLDPPGPIGQGGWGFGYGVAKGGCDRMAGLINAELGKDGVVAFNVEPGFVASFGTREFAKPSFSGVEPTPPEAIGAVIAWLATSEEAVRFRKKRVHAPELCRSKNLLPEWQASPGSPS